MMRKSKSKRGVTIAETLVAAFLLLLLVRFSVEPVVTSSRAAGESERRLHGLSLAEQQMGLATTGNFTNLASSTTNVTQTWMSHGANVTTTYQCIQTVTVVSPQLKDVTVTIQWQEAARTRSLTIESQLLPVDGLQ